MIDYSDNPVYRRIYIYDGNRIIAELDPDESGEAIFVKTYTWGMDIGSTLGSASGNIGGLCAIDNWVSGEQYQVGYDGSGNVSLLVNAKTGTLEAEVEYSAFGELVRTTGKWRETPFLYSTKWHLDYGPQSGLLWPLHLYDYGLRVYDPNNGRFLNRDPIGDQGGNNLYAFVGNNPVNNWDYMGLDCMDIISGSWYWWENLDNYNSCEEDQNKMELYRMYLETNGSGPTGPPRSLRSAQGGWSWGLGGGISFHRPSSQKTEYTDTTFKRTRTVGFNVTYSTMPYDSQFFYFSWDKYYNTDGDEITRTEAIGIQSFEAYREEAKSASGDSGDYDVGDLKLNLSPEDRERMGLKVEGKESLRQFGGLEHLTYGQISEETRKSLEIIASNGWIAMQISRLWRLSRDDDGNPTTEHGMWIYFDISTGGLRHINMPTEGATESSMIIPAPPYRQGWKVIAFFHTHPSFLGGSRDRPSIDDRIYAGKHHIPGIIKSENGLLYFGPKIPFFGPVEKSDGQ